MRKQLRMEKTAGMRCLAYAGVAVLLWAAGCHSVRVQTDYDPSASFSEMKAFAWLEPPEVEGADPFADNTLLRKRLRSAIELGLVARGFRLMKSAEEADFLATYSVILAERIRDDGSWRVGYGAYRSYGYGVGYSSPHIHNYQESTLLIDVVDPKSGDLLWRGWGSGVVGTRDRKRSDDRLNGGVRQILDRFPPESAMAPDAQPD